MLRAGLISKGTDSLKPQSEHAMLGDERPAVASSPLYSARCRAKTTVAPGSVIAKAGSTGDDGGSRTGEGRNATCEQRRWSIFSEWVLRKLHGKGIALRASCACTSCYWNRDLSEGALCAGRSNTALAQIDANSTPTAPTPIIFMRRTRSMSNCLHFQACECCVSASTRTTPDCR
jgi:hypothetical protein